MEQELLPSLKNSWKTGKDSEQECGALRQDSAVTAGNTYLTTERRNVVLHEMAKSKQTPNALTYSVCARACNQRTETQP